MAKGRGKSEKADRWDGMCRIEAPSLTSPTPLHQPPRICDVTLDMYTPMAYSRPVHAPLTLLCPSLSNFRLLLSAGGSRLR